MIPEFLPKAALAGKGDTSLCDRIEGRESLGHQYADVYTQQRKEARFCLHLRKYYLHSSGGQLELNDMAYFRRGTASLGPRKDRVAIQKHVGGTKTMILSVSPTYSRFTVNWPSQNYIFT